MYGATLRLVAKRKLYVRSTKKPQLITSAVATTCNLDQLTDWEPYVAYHAQPNATQVAAIRSENVCEMTQESSFKLLNQSIMHKRPEKTNFYPKEVNYFLLFMLKMPNSLVLR